MFPLPSWTFVALREGKCGGTPHASRWPAIRTGSTSYFRGSNALSSAAAVSGAFELKSCCHRDSACWLHTFNGSRMRLVSNCPSQCLLFVPQEQCEPLRTTSVSHRCSCHSLRHHRPLPCVDICCCRQGRQGSAYRHSSGKACCLPLSSDATPCYRCGGGGVRPKYCSGGKRGSESLSSTLLESVPLLKMGSRYRAFRTSTPCTPQLFGLS
jgi:hypothetical protein